MDKKVLSVVSNTVTIISLIAVFGFTMVCAHVYLSSLVINYQGLDIIGSVALAYFVAEKIEDGLRKFFGIDTPEDTEDTQDEAL